MQLISSKDTVSFLSNAAPRPWVKLMLLWCIFNEGLLPYFTKGRIAGTSTKVAILHYKNISIEGLKNNQAIQKVGEVFSQEIARRIVNASDFETIEDEAIEWDSFEEPHSVGSGFFIFADLVNWESGTIIGDIFKGFGNLQDHLFWDEEEHLVSNFPEDQFNFHLEGLCFEKSAIEMMLPVYNLELQDTPRSKPVKSGRIGRPRKWDWDGAMAYIVSVAQHPDGLPTGDGAQAKIENMISDWFVSQTGDSPATSQIRQRASVIIASILKAEN